MTDPIVDAVCDKLQARSELGIKKYGTTLADNPATVKEKLIHIQEELMEKSVYRMEYHDFTTDLAVPKTPRQVLQETTGIKLK